MTTYVNNYTETVQAVKKFTLEHLPEGLRPSTYEELVAMVATGSDADLYGLEFRRPIGEKHEAEATLYVRFSRASYDRHEDSEGNIWQEYQLEVKPSWPSWGNMDLDLAIPRLALMTEIAEFGRSIRDAFPATCWLLSVTKEEREESAKQQEKNRIQSKVNILVGKLPERKHMRTTAGAKLIIHEDLRDIQVGKYTIYMDNDKVYTLEVCADNTGYLHRTH